MKTSTSARSWLTAHMAVTVVVLLLLTPLATAQTPEPLTPTSTESPVVVTETPTATDVVETPTDTPTETATVVVTSTETPVDETPVPTTPPATEVPPTEIPATSEPTPTETQVTLTPTSTELPETPTPTPTDTPEAPTPTPTITVAVEDDSFDLAGSSSHTIAPGETLEITGNYSVGSDRTSTVIEAELTAVGANLDGWGIAAVDRTDTDTNNPLHVAFIDSTSTASGTEFDITWRVTAPAHIEKPVTVSVKIKSNAVGGADNGIAKITLLTVTATASTHDPSVKCVESADLTWACSYDTSHPDPITLATKVTVPTGWFISINGSVAADAQAASSIQAPSTGSFTIVASYPIGCPDLNASQAAMVTSTFTYPSGDSIDIESSLALVFDRPNPRLAIETFSFGDLSQDLTLTSTGVLALRISDAPCGWQATIDLTELTGANGDTIDATFTVNSVVGLPNGSVTMVGNTATIRHPESGSGHESLLVTINLNVTLDHQVQPGGYTVGVITQVVWLDGL